MFLNKFVSVGLLLLAGPGCGESGPRRAEVKGTVQLNGRPITEGLIRLIPIDGTAGPETGAAIIDGSYHIPLARGATVGRNRVELRSSRKTGGKIQDPTAKPGVFTDEFTEAFPANCNARSNLVREIEDGVNTLDFDIRAKQ